MPALLAFILFVASLVSSCQTAPPAAPRAVQNHRVEMEILELVDMSRVRRHDDPDVQAAIDRNNASEFNWAIKFRVQSAREGQAAVIEMDTLKQFVQQGVYLENAEGQSLPFWSNIRFFVDGHIPSPATTFTGEWQSITLVIYSPTMGKGVRRFEAVGYRFQGPMSFVLADGKWSSDYLRCKPKKFRVPLTVEIPERNAR